MTKGASLSAADTAVVSAIYIKPDVYCLPVFAHLIGLVEWNRIQRFAVQPLL